MRRSTPRTNTSQSIETGSSIRITQDDCPSNAMLADLAALYRDEGAEIFGIAAANVFLTAAAAIAHVDGAARLHGLILQLGPLHTSAKPN
jgi:hypothetical protein